MPLRPKDSIRSAARFDRLLLELIGCSNGAARFICPVAAMWIPFARASIHAPPAHRPVRAVLSGSGDGIRACAHGGGGRSGDARHDSRFRSLPRSRAGCRPARRGRGERGSGPRAQGHLQRLRWAARTRPPLQNGLLPLRVCARAVGFTHGTRERLSAALSSPAALERSGAHHGRSHELSLPTSHLRSRPSARST